MIPPKLITVGVIAETLDVNPDRVRRILRTRRHILPAAYAGNIRLFTSEAISQVRLELDGIDDRRADPRRGCGS